MSQLEAILYPRLANWPMIDVRGDEHENPCHPFKPHGRSTPQQKADADAMTRAWMLEHWGYVEPDYA